MRGDRGPRQRSAILRLSRAAAAAGGLAAHAHVQLQPDLPHRDARRSSARLPNAERRDMICLQPRTGAHRSPFVVFRGFHGLASLD